MRTFRSGIKTWLFVQVFFNWGSVFHQGHPRVPPNRIEKWELDDNCGHYTHFLGS